MDKEIKYTESLGALPYLTDVRDYRLSAPAAAADEGFPTSFALKTPKIKNQGSVGSCVAHSIAEVIEYFTKKQEGVDRLMSTGFIYGNRRNSTHKTSGMNVRAALANVCKYGDPLKVDFSENKEVPEAIELFEERFKELKDKAYPNRLSTYFRLKTADDIKYALMNYGPVVFAMRWYKGIKVDSDGVMQVDTTKEKTGGHCMLIYGWNEKGWLIQNSWGGTWGKSGRAILPFDIEMTEAWGVTDEVTGEDPNIKKPFYNTTFLRGVAKVFNWFANLFKKKK